MSISTEITRLNTNINNLKQTKQDIKNAVNNDFTEITNEQIENYAQKIKDTFELYKDQIPFTETEKSTEIAVNDAMVYSKNKIELFGNTEQQNYTGKNLMNYNNSNFTASDTSWRFLDGKSGAYGSNVGTKTNIKTPVVNGTTYTISFNLKTNVLGSNLIYEDETFAASIPDNTIAGQKIRTFTASRDGYVILRVRQTTGEKIQIENIQIEEGSAATSYEPYVGGVPAPNPSFPQQIHIVTGNNIIKVNRKNLFDKNIQNNKKFFILNDNGEEVSSNASQYSQGYTQVQPNTTYTLQGSLTTSTNNTRIYFYDKNKNWINRSSQIGLSQLPYTFTTDSNTHFIQFQTVVITYDEDTIQLEKGPTATSYEPYYHQDYSLNLGLLELCRIGDYQDYIYKNGDNWYKYENIKKIILNGSENWNYSDINEIFYISSITDYKKNGNIPISNYYTGISNVSDVSNLNNNIICFKDSLNPSRLYIKNTSITSTVDFVTWLISHNVIVYYILNTPAITQITNTTLISQLETIYNHLQTTKGINNIVVTASDLAPYMKLNYKKLETNENSL